MGFVSKKGRAGCLGPEAFSKVPVYKSQLCNADILQCDMLLDFCGFIGYDAPNL